MNKILSLCLISTLTLFANFFPNTIHTTISKVQNGQIILKRPIQEGTSCAIVHDYGNNIKALTHMCKQENGKIELIDIDTIHHDNIPTINTKPKAGDVVIGGYLYSNILLLTPNEEIYKNLTKQYNKKWIHPDLYALFLSQEGDDEVTKESLKNFAKRYQIGLIMIVKTNQIVLFDPYSKHIVATKSYKADTKKAKYPFYMHFEELESGWFAKKDGNYYQEMEKIK
jgi:hypothetical protein